MLAHRHAFQRQLAVRFGHGDEREIGGAAADIDHQDEVAGLYPIAPVGVAFDPGVEGGLRLFQERDVAIAGLLGSFQGEFARHRVEGCGDRHQHLLRGEFGVGHAGVPGFAQMFEVTAAGFERRNFGDALGRMEGQQRRGAIDG